MSNPPKSMRIHAPPGLAMTKLEQQADSSKPTTDQLQIPSFLDQGIFDSPLEESPQSRERRFNGDLGEHAPDEGSSGGSHIAMDTDSSPPSTTHESGGSGPHGAESQSQTEQSGDRKPASSYPGVVMGSGATLCFDDVALEDTTAEFLDPTAASAPSQAKTKPAGANIAPWLQDDGPPSPAATKYPREVDRSPSPGADSINTATSANASSISVDQRKSHLHHFPSVPHLPRFLHRHQRDSDSASFTQPYALGSNAPSIRSSSASSLLADGAQTPTSNRPHSVREPRDPSPPSTPPSRHGSVATTGGHFHAPPHRFTRFGSQAAMGSNTSLVSQQQGEKKKGGFLGNLLKRRTGQSVAGVPGYSQNQDFAPAQRNVTAGPSRMSVSTTASSLRNQSISSTKSAPSGSGAHHANRQLSIKSEGDGAYSPLHEGSEEEMEGHEFQLNTDLDDMEGIVDPRVANSEPRQSAQMAVSPVAPGEMGLADALHHTSSFASDESGNTQGAVPRDILEANTGKGNFTRPNPFISPTSSIGGDGPSSMGTPPSPFTVSPKHSIVPGQSNQPRRPSQLRNVKMGSIDSNNSEVSSIQPIGPSWAQGMMPAAGMFKDPFSPSAGSTIPERQPVSPSRQATLSFSGQSTSSAGHGSVHSTQGGMAPPIPAYSSGAAWAAPESWGVEGDEEDIDEDDTSSNSGTEGEWHDGDRVQTPTGVNGGESPGEAVLPSGAQTPFNKSRAPRGSVWPLKRTKADSKPSGPDFNPAIPHFTRIYRADGSYEIMSFLLNNTVSEIINTLAGNEGKKAHSMKLYVRERGQDRLMLPSERPIALQARRLCQSGFTEAEHIEEIGKDDWSMLCKFIYQTPVLPVMNPDEESSYESFEFIDLSGRDLQVIPIFLHLHADNIIILNVSRNPMTDIPLDFIQACKSLKELRMSNMALKRVPQSIRESDSLSRLDLSCNRISDLEQAQLSDISTLLSLKVQNNRLSSIPSYFIQMKALKYLNISNNVFEEFPSVVCEMSNLVDLDVSFNRIAQLPAEMSNLKSLERLICVGNELKEFPKSFSTLANLRVLDVRRNKLIDLTPVYALPNLATLRADSNDLVTLDTQLGAKVRDFSVPWNSITRFTLAPKPGMTAAYALTQLNLSHGKLSTLEDSALSELSNLVELNLSFNQFTRLPQTLDKLSNLEVFECTDNMLAALPAGSFGNMQKLRICNLHNNNLKDIPSDIWLCGSIETINMSSNLLNEFPDPPEEWFERMKSIDANDRKMSTVSAATNMTGTSEGSMRVVPPAGNSLLRLFLADNRLTDDVFHQISFFPNLKVLNVSFNEILEVLPYISRCVRLESLYLSGNKLTSLPAEDLEKLTNLRVLHLNGNKLQTLPSELGSIKNLEHLDVGSNVLKYNIANWPYDWNWNWNTALRYLNLSGNKRFEIKPTSGQELSHAAAGTRRELSDFNALSHLRVLGLMDVTLRIPSLPDESDEKRVRTSFSDINNMAYGISDMLGSVDHLAMFDLVVPHFRGSMDECVFGMFGRSTPSVPSGKIPKYIQDHFALMLADQLSKLQPEEPIDEALRRTFLWINKSAFDNLAGIEKRHRDSTGDFMGTMSRRANMQTQLRTGACGAVVYLKEKTLHVANAGDTLVVISRKGEAELLGKRHDPTERLETARIRNAEAWVSPKGLVNDDKEIDVSRAFGFYQALPAVNASPDARTRQLTESDEFLIIGNSALWKCTPYQTAVDIARTARDDPMMAAQKLRDFAISYGAEGSVMVMVVNVSDLFAGRMGIRGRQPTGGNDGVEQSYVQRRRREEVGDRTLNRLQQEIEPPTGQVAIVFTDIVNSTALWETNPGMPTAIKMHHSFMRRQLRLDGGYEVKTEGDSFMVSFQSVTAALLWAFNCQIGLLQLEWPRELLESEDGKVVYDSKGVVIHRGLRVRMGVHWGSPECERDPITRRMDYYGPMVNRAARINASADGGQLMTSQDVVNVIRELREYIESDDDHSLEELPDEVKREVVELRRIGGLELKDVGEKKLKGLEVPEKLSLLLPKTLSGRLELFTGLRANVEVNEARAFASEKQLEETRQLSALTLRLEALCTYTSPGDRTGVSSPQTASFPSAPRKALPLPVPAHYLGPSIRENMTEDELIDIAASLTTRIENCLSTLYIQHLGGLASLMSALGGGGRDAGLGHALIPMNGEREGNGLLLPVPK